MTSEQPEGLNLEPHPLVKQLHPDPDDAQDLISLVGYLGPSKQPDNVRLYSDLSFRNYYEIPSDGIVATTPTDADDPNSPTSVHVKANARVDVVSVASQNVEAGFLRGAITSGYLGGAAGGAAQGGVIQPTPTASVMTQCGACPTHHPQQCPSHTVCTVCTITPACPGGAAQIGAAQVPTATPSAITQCGACQTHHPQQCPSHTVCTVCTITPACPGGAGGPQVAAATLATVCTQGQGCLWPTTLCIHTVNVCPQAEVGGAAQVGTIGPTGVFHCTTATVATVCTQGHGCVGPTTFCAGPQAGVGAAGHGQAAGILPPSIGFGCTWVCTQGCTFTPVCHQGGAGQGQAAQVGAAHPTGMPGCTWVCTQGCTFTPVCHPGGVGQAQAAIANPATFECTWRLPNCPPGGGGVPHSHLLGCTWVCTQGCTFTPVCPTIQCP